MKKVLLLSVVLLMALAGCNGGGDNSGRAPHREKFKKTEKIEPVKVAINEILEPYVGVCTGDFLVFQTYNSDNNDLMYVYDAETLEFLYSFLHKGNGPGEAIYPGLVHGTKSNHIMTYDQVRSNILEFRLTRQGAEFLPDKEYPLNRKRTDCVNDMYVVNDSVLLYYSLGFGGSKLYSYNKVSGKIIDEFNLLTNIDSEVPDNRLPSYKQMFLGYRDGDIYLAMQHVNEILHGKVDGAGNLSMDKQQVDLSKCDREDAGRCINYYGQLEISDRYMLAPYNGLPKIAYTREDGKQGYKPVGEMQLEVYSADMKPLAVLIPSDVAHSYVIDDKRERFYAWNYAKDFEELYIYPLPHVK